MAICLFCRPSSASASPWGIAGMLRLELPLLLVGFGGITLWRPATTDYGIQLLDAARRNIKSSALTSRPGSLAATAGAAKCFGPISNERPDQRDRLRSPGFIKRQFRPASAGIIRRRPPPPSASGPSHSLCFPPIWNGPPPSSPCSPSATPKYPPTAGKTAIFFRRYALAGNPRLARRTQTAPAGRTRRGYSSIPLR